MPSRLIGIGCGQMSLDVGAGTGARLWLARCSHRCPHTSLADVSCMCLSDALPGSESRVRLEGGGADLRKGARSDAEYGAWQTSTRRTVEQRASPRFPLAGHALLLRWDTGGRFAAPLSVCASMCSVPCPVRLGRGGRSVCSFTRCGGVVVPLAYVGS